MGFSEDEVNALKEQFTLFDMIGEGNIPAKEIGLVVRSLGKCVTEADLKDILEQVGVGENVTLNEFLEIMEHKMPEIDPQEILDSLKVFDKEGDGKIAVSELKHILMKMGEQLTERQVNDVLSDANIDDEGFIKYEKFVASLLEQYVV